MCLLWNRLEEGSIHDYILLTDSDTIINVGSDIELAKVLDNNEKVGAVSGDVRLFTMDTFLSFIPSFVDEKSKNVFTESSLDKTKKGSITSDTKTNEGIVNFKYWFAFNLERASQSYFNVVNCVSGPLGMYRLELLEDILDPWLNQQFLGKTCTYGDDRHLTNLILSKGHGVMYTHKAISYTESPSYMSRWIAQQTRWTKSYIREALINMQWFHKHNIYLALEILFGLFYSFLLMAFVVITVIKFTIHADLILLGSLLVISFLRGFVGVMYEKDISYIYYSLYSMLYLLVLLPIKIWSVLTLSVSKWGTSGRNEKKNFCGRGCFNSNSYIDSMLPMLWFFSVLTGLGYAVYVDVKHWEADKYLMYSIGLYILVLLLFYPLIIYKFRRFSRKIQNIILERPLENRKDNNTMLNRDLELEIQT